MGTVFSLIALHEGLENWICKQEFLCQDCTGGSDPLKKYAAQLNWDLGKNSFLFS